MPSQHKPMAPVRRAKTPDPEPSFLRYKVGDTEIAALYDGIWEKVHDAQYFGNATVGETKHARLTTEFVPIPITVFAVKLNSKLILCDAGGGGQVQAFNANSDFVSRKMVATMKVADIDPRAVETISVSHFHHDHIFGLLERKTSAPVFLGAEIIVPAAEYKWWTDPLVITRLPEARCPLARRIHADVSRWRNVLPVEDFVSAPGHTPGRTAFHLTSDNAELMISNDAAYVPVLSARHPERHGAFDPGWTDGRGLPPQAAR